MLEGVVRQVWNFGCSSSQVPVSLWRSSRKKLWWSLTGMFESQRRTFDLFSPARGVVRVGGEAGGWRTYCQRVGLG